MRGPTAAAAAAGATSLLWSCFEPLSAVAAAYGAAGTLTEEDGETQLQDLAAAVYAATRNGHAATGDRAAAAAAKAAAKAAQAGIHPPISFWVQHPLVEDLKRLNALSSDPQAAAAAAAAAKQLQRQLPQLSAFSSRCEWLEAPYGEPEGPQGRGGEQGPMEVENGTKNGFKGRTSGDNRPGSLRERFQHMIRNSRTTYAKMMAERGETPQLQL